MTQYVYVTGCDTGFGNIVTKKLDKLGYGVFAGCYMAESCETLKKECSDRVHPVQLDVTKEESVDRCAQEIKDVIASKPGSTLFALVNNAGILVTPGPVEWTPHSSYRRMFDVNCMGMVMVTKSVLSLIRESQGRIVNVASVAGRIGLPSEPAYCGSKYFVEGYSDILRRDMLEWNVTVHIIEPGVFSKTGLYGNYQTGLDQLWETLDPKLKEDYGQDYYQYYRKLLGSALLDFGNTNSNLVPEAMVDALTSKRPKYRYRVGNDSKYLITFLTWVHESLQDTLMTLGDFRNPYVKPVSAPKNAKALAQARYVGSPYKYWFMLFAIYWAYKRFTK